VTVYDATSDSFVGYSELRRTLRTPAAVSRDGSLIAVAGNPPGIEILGRDLTSRRVLPDFDGGFGFDSRIDVLYAIYSSATFNFQRRNRIVALDTSTWEELYRFEIGESVPPDAQRRVLTSPDGGLLFVPTPLGVRLFELPEFADVLRRENSVWLGGIDTRHLPPSKRFRLVWTLPPTPCRIYTRRGLATEVEPAIVTRHGCRRDRQDRGAVREPCRGLDQPRLDGCWNHVEGPRERGVGGHSSEE
jgi:hypothetical protein